jgi:hypothetical protein
VLERFKTLFGGSAHPGGAGEPANGLPAVPGEPQSRPSNGLNEFFQSLQDRSGLSVLDFGGANQENISFITMMGHRLSSEDFVRSVEMTFGTENTLERQSDPRLLDDFVRENLEFPPDHFDGALLWDGLQLLSPHLLQLTVDRLHDTMRPGSCMLAFLYSDDRVKQVPMYHYRIADHSRLNLMPRGFRPAHQFFNNRTIEKLFHKFKSVKFFLARDGLREIIVRR